MDQNSLLLLILAVLIVGPAILFYVSERVNRTVDEAKKRPRRSSDEHR